MASRRLIMYIQRREGTSEWWIVTATPMPLSRSPQGHLYSFGCFRWRWYQCNYHFNIHICCVLDFFSPWWRHQMETFSALMAICARNSPVPGEFPVQRPVTRSFDVFFDLRPNKLLRKQSWGWWFETPSHPLWGHRNASSAMTVLFCSAVCDSKRL